MDCHCVYEHTVNVTCFTKIFTTYLVGVRFVLGKYWPDTFLGLTKTPRGSIKHGVGGMGFFCYIVVFLQVKTIYLFYYANSILTSE